MALGSSCLNQKKWGNCDKYGKCIVSNDKFKNTQKEISQISTIRKIGISDNKKSSKSIFDISKSSSKSINLVVNVNKKSSGGSFRYIEIILVLLGLLLIISLSIF